MRLCIKRRPSLLVVGSWLLVFGGR
jgi:hypothetical protein